MKRTLHLMVICLFLATAVPTGLQAQVGSAAAPAATFNENMELQLPDVKVMPMMFVLDLQTLDLDDYYAERYFASISDNLVHYQLTPDGTSVQIRPQYANVHQGPWTPEQWQSYLNSKATRYLDYLNRFKAE